MATKFVLIGSGLAGGLLAAYLGRRGHDVDLYERRADPREGNIVGGRSIKLAPTLSSASMALFLQSANQCRRKYRALNTTRAISRTVTRSSPFRRRRMVRGEWKRKRSISGHAKVS